MKPEKNNLVYPQSDQGRLYHNRQYLSMKKISQIIGKESNQHTNSHTPQINHQNAPPTTDTGCPYCCENSKKLQILRNQLKSVLKETSTLRQGFFELSEEIELLSRNFSFIIELVEQNINREAQKFADLLHSTNEQHRQTYKIQNLETISQNKKLLERNRQLQKEIQNLHISTDNILQQKARLTQQLKELTKSTWKSHNKTTEDATNKNHDVGRAKLFTMKKYKTFDQRYLTSKENSLESLKKRLKNLKQMIQAEKECLSDKYTNSFS